MRKKNNLAIFLFADHNYFFCIGNIVLQLRRFSFIDKFIIYLDLEDINTAKKILEKIDNRIEIFDKTNSKISEFITDEVKNSDFVKRYSLIPFARIFAIDHLADYENVLILDSDIFVKDKFQDIIFELPKADLTWRHAGEFKKLYQHTSSDILYPSGALININKSLFESRDQIKKLYFNFINDNIDKIPHVDELAFAFFAEQINAKINYLTRYFNTFIYYPDTNESQVICAVGKYKFWSHPICALLYPEWIDKTREFNEICKNNGGEQFIIKDMATELNKADLFKFYENWLEIRPSLKLNKITDIRSIDINKLFIIRSLLDEHKISHTFQENNNFGGTFNFPNISKSIQIEFYKNKDLYHIDLIENNILDKNTKDLFYQTFNLNYFVLLEENNKIRLNYNSRNFYKFIQYFRILINNFSQNIDYYELNK